MGVLLWTPDLHLLAGLSSSTTLRTISVFVVSFVLCKFLLQRALGHWAFCASFPPGPRGWPLVGYTPFLGKYPHKVMAQLAKVYGDVFSLSIGPQTVVIVNGARAVREALIQHGSHTSGRTPPARAVAVDTLLGYFWSSGDLWFTQRKFGQSCLRQFTATGDHSFHAKIEREATELCAEIARRGAGRAPVEIGPLLDIASANVMCLVIFGYRFQYDDVACRRIREYSAELQKKGFSGLDNYLPFLYKFPFLFRDAKEKKFYIRSFILERLYHNRKPPTDPTNMHSLAQLFYVEIRRQNQGDNSKRIQFTEDHVVSAAWDMFIAGVETTSFTLAWAMLFMVLHTDKQKKIQNEIDSLIGQGKTPLWSEKENMPYTRATIMEIQRCASVVPIALPHTVTEDIKLCGYTVPKGTVLFVNLWSLLNDPEQWENPSQFMPERFLDENNCLTKPETFLPFSAGPRVCMGEQLAKRVLFDMLTTILNRFHLTLPEGEPRPSVDAMPGMSCGPHPFRICVSQRK